VRAVGKERERSSSPFQWSTCTGAVKAPASLNNDFRALYKNQSFVQDLIKFLVKWGFITAEKHGEEIRINKDHALKYISAIARSGLIAVIQEREKIEQEEKGDAASAGR